MDNHHDDNRSTDAERDGKLEEGVAQARLARDLATAFDRFARSLEVSPRAARAVPPPHVSFTERDEIAARRALGKKQ